jgi:NAD(P)-dependent dehydrogenase (short-subunit alcohol dehydrogenase family)
MQGDLTGRVALVSGAARGIGRAVGLTLARDGADVVVADLDLAKAEETAGLIDGPRTLAARVDVSSEESVTDLYATVLAQLGKVDILVNSAGIFKMTDPLAITAQEWDGIMAVNARGTFLMCREALRHMKAAGQGTIVNVASTAGKSGGSVMAGMHYAASKAVVICLTKSLAKYVAPQRIRVNAVAPGPTVTEMTAAWGDDANAGIAEQIPLGRFADPQEIAEVVAFLASDRAGFITGEIVDVNGGLIMD